MLDILLDAGLDSVKMLPFLYLAYLLIEWIERTRGSRIEALLAEGSRWGAAVGAHCWAPFPSADSLPWQPAFTAAGSSLWEP